MGEQQSQKRGVRSEAQKEAASRRQPEPILASRPVRRVFSDRVPAAQPGVRRKKQEKTKDK